MARIGIGYEQVAAAADTLVGEGTVPTIRAVRERLGGTGSPNTIHKHLSTWRDAHPVAAAAAPTLSPELLSAIANEMVRFGAAERGVLQDLLVQAKDEATVLSAAGTALEGQLDDLRTELEGLTRERDTQAGIAAQQATDIAALQERIQRELDAAEAARRVAAEVKVRLDLQEVRLETQAAELDRLRIALTTAEAARIAAEQAAAVLTARLEARTDELKRAEGRVEEVARQVTVAAQALEAERTAAAQTAREALAAREAAREEATAARERAARLEGQVAVAEARAEEVARQAAASAAAYEAARAAAEQAHADALATAAQNAREAQAARDAARQEVTSARAEAAQLAGQVTALEAQIRGRDATPA